MAEACFIRRASRQELLEKSRAVLGWSEVLSALSARAESEPGKRFCLCPPAHDSLAECEAALSETEEMAVLLEGEDPPPAAPFSEVSSLIAAARAEGVLDPQDLLKISDLLFYAEAAKVFFAAHRNCRRLEEYASRLDPLRTLRRVLEKSLDRDGSLLDTASEELHSLRRRHHTLQERIHRRLAELVSRDPEAVLQDSFYTQRGQRYVVPVKAAHRHQFEGIVHDTSQSGQTVFVEPQELVEPNNQLKLLEAEIAAEVQRILRELSRRVAEAGEALLVNLEVLTRLDLIRARARLSLDLHGRRPTLNDIGRVRLFAARHPLLLLRRQEAVANDLHLGQDCQVLLVSGPNAGGKTVGLTMLGLFALMIRVGLFLPAAADSEMALFSEVYAVIGDEQDLSRDLSSFSAHLLDLIGILEAAGPRSLVLLDELMSSTDPAEGSALAAAVLTALQKRGAVVMATTHFPALKAFAHNAPGFENAGYAFDPETLQPTYRLLLGVPGRSLGLEMAGRLGLPPKILEQARQEIDDAMQRLEGLLGELSVRMEQVNQERRELAETTARLKKQLREYETLRAQMEEKEREWRRTARQTIKDLVQKTEKELENLTLTIRRKPALSREELQRGREQLKSLEQRMQEEIGTPAAEGEAPDWRKIQPGQRIALLPLLAEAELVERPAEVHDETKVKVRLGKIEVMVEAKKVRLLPEKGKSKPDLLHPPSPKKRKAPAQEKAVAPPTVSCPVLPPGPANTLDLRGRRVHEAEVLVEHFLDRACREHRINVFIIHGHGTEALKKLVRQQLTLSPYVEEFRPGEKGEGGDGVTMVRLKEWGLPG